MHHTPSFIRPLRAATLLVLVFFLAAAQALAQVDKATIEAVALDQARSPLPGVTVTVARPETGYSALAVTDAAGTARFLSLQPGSYQVSFQLEGFAPVKERKVNLLVGENANLSVTMQPQSSETITVSADAPVVDVHKTDSSTNIVPEQIESLPVPDRDFQRLAFIAPGVERERGAFRFISGGPVIGAGGNASQATILVDGVDFTDPALGLARTRFSQDAIREFRVIQNRFDTEIGGSAGGALSIITKSGTNDLHGNVFGFYRPNALRSTGKLDPRKGPFTRDQIGGTLGGPIVRDKLFFFGSLERVHEKNSVLFFPTSSFLDHPFDQTLVFGALNSQLNDKQTAAAHVVYERYDEDNFRAGGVADASYGQTLTRRNWNATFEHNAVVSPASSNEARMQFGSHKYEEPTNSTTVAEWFNSGNSFQTGGNILGDLLGKGSTWEVRDTLYHHLSLGRSTHDLKAGASAQHVTERSRIDTYAYGLFIYLTGDRSLPLAYAYGVGSSDVETHTNLYGGFVEDAWRPSAKSVINLGLRYDVDTNGNNAGFTHPLIPNPRPRDTNNYQPRFSFSYDLTGTGSNVIRGGAGRFTGRFLLVPALQELQQNGVTGRVTYTRVNGALFGIPALALDPAHPTTTGIPSKPAIILLSPDFKNPESDQASLGWTSRVLSSRLFFDTELVYVKGRDEVTIHDVNFSGNATHIRPNKNYDQINMYDNSGRSKYQAVVFSLNGNVRQNDLVTASLTFASKKNISDDFSPEFPFGYPNDPANMQAEYGRARGTERYRLVVTGVLHGPWGLLFSPIYEYGSGQPWTHRLGYDANGDGKNSDRPAGVGRNTMDGPPFRQLSLRITKALPLSGWGQVEAIAEAINVTNTTNLDVNSVDQAEFLSGPTATAPAKPNPGFGRYRANLPGRQVQLGLRCVY